ncbi:MAG: hypothetical protein CMJ70_02090 [Planctomycetaceae bacterium]|nr:hypothetical protein [Planctomycetaceae bacterium]|tara:strand:+ start:308 stop:1633 length:1326 start_codon:yes stop_codon:yes gene_type:complete
MKPWFQRCTVFTLFLLLATAVSAQNTAGRRLDLQDGDTLVFCGDSITHQCLYTQYVETYFYTRYPQRRITFHNASVGGDKVGDALSRFDIDIAPAKPKYVSILLGMNDGTYQAFQPEVFKTYETGMVELIEKIQKLGARPIPMHPTMHDLRAREIRSQDGAVQERYKYYNSVLAFYGTWLQEHSRQQGLSFVNMFARLNRITYQQRRQNPDFTLIKDAVHPDAPGQAVMAASMLDDVHANRLVSALTVVRRGQSWQVRARNGEVSEVGEDDLPSFTFRANSLPWVVPQEALEGYKLFGAGGRLSGERLRVVGLPPGRYALKIDDQVVGSWYQGTLAGNISLHANRKTPQYQQALAVAMLNKERNEKVVHALRDHYRTLRDHYRQGLDKKDPQKFAQFVTAFKAKAADFKAQSKAYEDKIYQINQPQPHRYQIVRATKKAVD